MCVCVCVCVCVKVLYYMCVSECASYSSAFCQYDMTSMLHPQAAIYKSDFEHERSDREKAMGRLEEERRKWKGEVRA